MSLQDPVSDMLTIIRNGQQTKKESVKFFYSKLREGILKLLLEEGFINNIEVLEEDGKKVLVVHLKFFKGKPVIEVIKTISKPSRRVYVSVDKIPQVMGGLGVSIVSTSKGLMTGKKAKSIGVGGELICYVC